MGTQLTSVVTGFLPALGLAGKAEKTICMTEQFVPENLI